MVLKTVFTNSIVMFCTGLDDSCLGKLKIDAVPNQNLPIRSHDKPGKHIGKDFILQNFAIQFNSDV